MARKPRRPRVRPRARQKKAVEGEWSNKIKAWRDSRVWTQEYLAPLAKMSVSNLSLLENGLIKYSPKTLGNLAAVFGCKPEDLVDRDPDDKVAAITAAARRLSEGQQASLVQFIEKMVGPENT